MARYAIVAAVLAAGAFLGAAQASADPEDLVPWCSGDQTPMDTACKAPPSQVFTHEAPGANPDVPLGVDPDLEPAV